MKTPSKPAPYAPDLFSEHARLAQAGARVREKVEQYLASIRAGTPRSGAEHWLAQEAFSAIRDLGLLAEASQ